MLQSDRNTIAKLIYSRLREEEKGLKQLFQSTKDTIGYFYIDHLLPEPLVADIYKSFPGAAQMVRKKTLKEYKHVSAQMDAFPEILEEVLYAFQETAVVDIITKICGYSQVEPDAYLYAGGLSRMEKDNYLLPHLDNSHDKDRNRYRVLNLLYYVTPDWHRENGGNLELWPKGLDNAQVTIDSKCNRLVVMATHTSSWHSVSKVVADRGRCCISNYYFSAVPQEKQDKFHVTTFRARPGQTLANAWLQLDSSLRMLVRKVFAKGIRENPHVYKKNK